MQLSVIIPTYNSAGFIEKALLSVCQQSYQQFEIIVSDDGSSDNTLQQVDSILSHYPDISRQILTNPHTGPGGARNYGIHAARYKWIAFLDSDDYWMHDKLAKVVDAMKTNQANLVFHNEIFFEEQDERRHEVNYVSRYDTSLPPFLALFRKNFLSPSSVVLAKSLLLEAGLFNTTISYAEDYDLWLRVTLLPTLRMYPLDEYLTYYVVRSGSLTFDTGKRLQGLLTILSLYRYEVQKLSSNSRKELSRFVGVAYTRCGWAYCKQGRIIIGIWTIVKGLFYDARMDYFKRLFAGLPGNKN